MTPVNAPIIAVTVFTDRARITRRGTARLTPGEHSLAIEGLPTTIEADSVRASGRGAGITILGAEVATQFVTKPPEALVADLLRQLEQLQESDRALADGDAVEAERIEFLRALRAAGGADLAKGLAYNRASLETVEALAGYLMRELEAAQTRRRAIGQQRRDLAREIEAVRARLNQVQHGQQQERREIRVTVEAAAEADLDLEVTYAVWGASWEPSYDIRLAADSSVSLSYLAQVRQQTGEDWPAVHLALSTARPAVNATIPELHPWYIDILRPKPPPMPMMATRAMAAPAAAAPQAFGGADMEMMALMDEAPAAPPAAKVAEATVESSGATVTYRVARPVAVPSDGSPHRTAVTTLDLGARLDYVTAPKIAAEAYLRARVTNNSAFVLLPGWANIFHDADFVGRTYLATIAPNEEFEAQLGVDDRVKVERELSGRTVDKTLIGNTRRIQFSYTITLTNLLATPARITVLDQLPMSRHEAIKVKLQDAAPKLAEHSDLNILTWELELKPQEKRSLFLAFVVEHPRDMTVVGIS
jgi:uncharacterized protein (TIGR02231 family)